MLSPGNVARWQPSDHHCSQVSTSVHDVAPAFDPADLVDAVGVAEILGLSSRGAVSVYRSRYDDFPTPVLDLGKGRPMLWLRADVEAWAKSRR